MKFLFHVDFKGKHLYRREKGRRTSWAQGDGFTLQEQNAQKHPPSSLTPGQFWTITPLLVCGGHISPHFSVFLSLSPERLYISTPPLSLKHIYTNTPSNVGLKHTDFNLWVITYSTGARGFGLPSCNTCLVYILHHTDAVRRPDLFPICFRKLAILLECTIYLSYN